MDYSVLMSNIYKSFYGVKVLDNVQLNVRRGSVHALMGENGAGKSTLMKILTGIYSKDNGEIFIDGDLVDIKNVRDSIKLGVSMIHQELSPMDEMTVAQNIFLGREIMKKSNVLNDKAMVLKAQDLMDDLNISINVSDYMKSLSVAQIQLVEIVKAVSCDAKIIIMDEPTSALTDKEVDILFRIMGDLRSRDKSIIYISHKMDEIFEICDEITVMRDGKFIETRLIEEFTFENLISSMVGRKLSQIYPKDNESSNAIKMKVENLTKSKQFKNISFDLKKGEILGFAGLVGAGRTEVMEAIYGYKPSDSGRIFIDGIETLIRSPKDALKEKIAYISEDRKKVGLNLLGSIRENITLANLDEYLKFKLVIDHKKEKAIAKKSIAKFRIKSSSEEIDTVYLSGGNQQKVLLAKCISCNPSILILDEPTRGIDIGSKSEIYKLMNDFVNQGNSIIMVSSEMPEIIGMSDRIMVMHEGTIAGILNKGEVTQEQILMHAAGKKKVRNNNE